MLPTSLLLIALAADPAPQPRLDADGIPLPTEAIQRLGSATFLVNNFNAAAFSPDGKTVYTGSGEDSSDWRQPYTSPGLIAWEVPTGKKLWQVGVDRRLEQVVADPDGKSVWVLERQKRKHDEDPDQLQRVRYATKDGKELARGPLFEEYAAPSLHPTGLLATTKSLAIEKQNEDPVYVQWVSVEDRDGKSIDIRPFEPKAPGFTHQFIWSPTADRLFVLTGATDQFRCLTALDITLKKQLWSIATDAIGGWFVAPDGKAVVVVTQKGNGETVYARRLDTKTGEEFGAVEANGVKGMGDIFGGSLNERGLIHFYPDGKTLYLIDEEERTLAIDVATWKTVPSKVKLAAHAVFSPDGRMTVAPDGRHVVIHEMDTGKRLSPAVGGFPYPDHNTGLRFAPASDRLIRHGHLTDETFTEWDLTTGRQSRRVEESGDREEKVGLSADGTTKAVVKKVGEEWQGTITNVNAPKDPPVTLKAGWKDGGWPYWSLKFTPNAAHLVGYDPDHGLHIWDTKRSGKPVEVEFARAGRGWINGEGMLISPNGRQVAAVESGHPVAQFVPPRDTWTWRIGVYEIPSGKLVHRFEGNGELEKFEWMDDRLAGVINLSGVGVPILGAMQPKERKFRLISLDPVAKTTRVHTDLDVRAWAAAPFGDTVAVGSSDGLRLYEASTGKLRHTFREQKRPVEVLAFSPNGRQLAAESVDGPILVWAVRGDLSKPAKPDADGWDRAWAALGEVDAPAGFQAVRLFALHPDDGVAELKRRFAEKPPTIEEIAAVVAKLDDRTFAVRLRAEQRLRAMGTVAFPALQKAMQQEPSEEFKERAGRLLAVQIPSDWQRAKRAVEALRLADTEAAKKLLAEWAVGDAKSPQTVAAKRK